MNFSQAREVVTHNVNLRALEIVEERSPSHVYNFI
ncbi:MAG: hypothetical protein G01um101433_432 [Parcubacteria group bacterium Gr01-1014_33]|nr:MAG: hypothetical protein G01um101433_432 [Parcubacteria group bacterium Gr01-1014_33]